MDGQYGHTSMWSLITIACITTKPYEILKKSDNKHKNVCSACGPFPGPKFNSSSSSWNKA